MPFLAEVTANDIEALGDIGLTDLLLRLISLECAKHGINERKHVNLRITIPDGGEDGYVEWDEGPPSTNYLPSRKVLFQVKAHIGPTALGKEVLLKDGSAIKPRIDAVLSGGGAYIVLCGNILERQGIEEREEKIREALVQFNQSLASAKIIVLDANRARDWVAGYPAAVIAVLAKAGRHPPEGTDTWEGLAKYPDYLTTYIRGDLTRDAAEAALRSFLEGDERVARLTGMPGLGKTRTIVEASRPRVGAPQLRGILFADANVSSHVLPAFLKQCRTIGATGCLVVDNCDADLHEVMQREVQHSESGMRLLTVGSDRFVGGERIPEVHLIPVSDDVIAAQIKDICPGLPERDVRFIADQLAEGFPQMAVLLARARLNEVSDIRQIVGPSLLGRLLGIRDLSHSEEAECLKACSIFSRLGFDGEAAAEYMSIAKFEGIDSERFYKLVRPFLEKGVLSRRGRYLEVRPKPLAWRLAADWWATCSPDKAQRLANAGLSEQMTEALCERVRMLDGVQEFVELTKILCKESGPFGQAELLNSDAGSRLFRAFCEVNPAACTHALHNAFRNWTDEDLRAKVGPGRRQLVWAMERLCFWADQFDAASRILLKFADAENETWSNNSTGILLGFFSPLLSGTQAGPIQRISLAKDALSSPSLSVRRLGMKCLATALKSGHYSRTAGSEQQGSRPPMEDWRPKVWQDIFDYWESAVDLLLGIMHPDDALKNEVAREIIPRLRGLFLVGRLETLNRIFAALAQSDRDVWASVTDTLRTIEKYDLGKAPQEANDLIQKWKRAFTPSELRDQLSLQVAKAPWDHEEDDNGNFVDLSAQKAIALAAALSRRPKDLIDNLPGLLFGEQRQTFLFAREIGAHSADVCKIALRCLRLYLTKSVDSWNSSFLSGLLNGVAAVGQTNAKIDQFLRLIGDDPRFASLLVPAATGAGLTEGRLGLIQTAAKRGGLIPRDIKTLAYGRATDQLNAAAMRAFILEIARLGPAFAWTAIDVLFMYCHGNKERWTAQNSTFASLLLDFSLFESDFQPDTMDLHHVQEIGKQIAKLGSGDVQIRLAEMVAKTASSERGHRLDEFSDIAAALLRADPAVHWPILAEPMLSEGWLARDGIAQVLGNRFDKNQPSPLSSVPAKVLIEWCERHPHRGPQALVEYLPLFEGDDAEYSAILQALVERFGNNESVLDRLSVNIHTFAWTGSPIPYYLRNIGALTNLIEKSRHASVRAWGRERIQELEKMVDRQKLEDEERA